MKGPPAFDSGNAGFVTEGLLARDVRVIAVDRSARMLEALRRKFPRLERLECRIGQAKHLPISDRSVDYCLANMFLHHVERPLVAIREMVRILEPGGTVVVTDLDVHEYEFLRDEHHDRWLGFERRDVLDWFCEAGLAEVRIESLDDECRATSKDDEDAAIGIFIAVGTRPAAVV